MNRLEEYRKLLQELETVPEETAASLEKAKSRFRHRQAIRRSLAGVAAAFCIFVGAVNLSPTVAAACMEIPLLDKLTEAVMFSPSLQKAVENNYVQPLGLEQSQNEITVRVEHVIVDQKQLHIFYTIHTDAYPYLVAVPDLLDADSGEPAKVISVYGDDRVTLGEMRHILADFGDGEVPSQLRLSMELMEVSVSEGEEAPTNEQWNTARTKDPVAVFDLLMQFDPQFTDTGKIVEANRTFELDGNRFTLSRLEIYPSHMRIQIEEDPQNGSWIKSLHFYLELEDGTVIHDNGNGISAIGNPDTPSMTTYMAESSYFDQVDQIRLCITGADFLEKDFGKTYVNLQTQEAENLPEGHEFVSAVQTGEDWELKFLHPDDGENHVQAFGEFFDSSGARISTNGMWWSGGEEATRENPVLRENGYYFKQVSGYEVWIEPHYSYFFYLEEPIVVEIVP